MGNFTSCTYGSFVSSISPSSAPRNMQQARCRVARVLLVDGSAMNFTTPIKVIKLLLDHPFHVICPLDTLIPGHHSLSSLLPDEELKLGHLYLLLPLKTFENRKCMPIIPFVTSGRPQKASKGLENSQISMMPNILRYSYNTNIGADVVGESAVYPNYGSIKALEEMGAREESAWLLNTQKSDAGCSISNQVGSGNDNVDNISDLKRPASAAVPWPTRFGKQKRLVSMATFNNSGRPERRCRRGGTTIRSNNTELKADDQGPSGRLCDTPELQMAYRSMMLRRCSSWTPRLQSITELNAAIVANSGSHHM